MRGEEETEREAAALQAAKDRLRRAWQPLIEATRLLLRPYAYMPVALFLSVGGGPVAGKVVGPSFAADEAADAVEAVIDTYQAQRQGGERFIDTIKRIGLDPFKASTNAVRRSTARHAETAAE